MSSAHRKANREYDTDILVVIEVNHHSNEVAHSLRKAAADTSANPLGNSIPVTNEYKERVRRHSNLSGGQSSPAYVVGSYMKLMPAPADLGEGAFRA